MFRQWLQRNWLTAPALILGLTAAGCAWTPGKELRRQGDEIMVAGQLFHTGTRVVLWSDPGGFDAYRVERRFAPWDKANWEDTRMALTNLGRLPKPNRYDVRANGLNREELERVRGGGWDLALLREHVDQLVLHYDAAGSSRACFKALQDQEDLSTHFLLDLDGTIYQTLDVKERAWHATTSNDRSVGVEIANAGAYPERSATNLARWYRTDDRGRTILVIPGGAGGERTANFEGRPVRRGETVGEVQGEQLRQYDFTVEQYRALARLTAALCTVLPGIRCDYPRDGSGKLAAAKLPDAQLKAYQGILGHYHIQTNKQDPGPALQWDYVIGEARRLMKLPALEQDAQGNRMEGPPRLIEDKSATSGQAGGLK
jgi:N-acetyl-anhydromuramyl-L-alanine amidase AmpD